MDIRCRKTQCKYNDRYTCKAKSILIGENDLCYTFEPSGEKKRDVSKRIFRKTPQYAPQRDTNKMKIECQNNCLFNKEGRCIANGITINDIAEKPCCMTILGK